MQMDESTIFDMLGTNIFLFLGNTGDQFIAKDLSMQSFESFLTQYLKEIGFHNILFYNNKAFKGRYALDEGSAERLIDIKAKENQTGRKTSPTPREARIRKNAAEDPAQVQLSAEEKWKTLTYGNSNVEISFFLETAFLQFKDREHKNAVVFSTVDSLLEHTEEFEKIFDENNRVAKYTGIVICIAQGHNEENFLEILRRYPFVAKYFIKENDEFKNGNVLRLGDPGQDEFERLLEHMRIVGIRKSASDGGNHIIKLDYDIRMLKKLAGLFRFYEIESKIEGYVKLSVARERLEAYMRQEENGGIAAFDENSISRIYRMKKEIPKSAMEELNRRGWEPVYEALTKITNDNRIRGKDSEQKQEREEKREEEYVHICGRMLKKTGNINQVAIPHYMLLGPPGTGKSTIAKLIGRVLYEAGILKSGHTVERKAGDLISQYRHGSDSLTEQAIREAKDGVLFIDEAYALVPGAEHGRGKENDYGQAVVNKLVSYTERQNQEEMPFCLILAGYKDELKRILEMNDGLAGRIPEENRLELKPYTADHLADIFTDHLRKAGYQVEEEVTGALPGYFEDLKASKPKKLFQNAREAINAAETVISNCNYRRTAEPTDSADRMILREDFGNKARFLGIKSEHLEDEILQIENRIHEILDTRVGNQGWLAAYRKKTGWN